MAKGWNKIAKGWNKIAKGWNKIFGMGNWGGSSDPPTPPPGYGPEQLLAIRLSYFMNLYRINMYYKTAGKARLFRN